MKIFPDANVLVANFMWDGVCAKIIDAIVLEKKHDLIVSAWVWEETRRTLHDTFSIPWALIDEYEEVLLGNEETVLQQTPLALSPCQVADPDDRVVLSSALTARSEVLVTGDKALLDVADQVRQTEGMLIITPAAFWQAKGTLW